MGAFPLPALFLGSVLAANDVVGVARTKQELARMGNRMRYSKNEASNLDISAETVEII
jgi:hypothetical protein